MTDESSTLSEEELMALAYFVVGVSSEGNIGGKDVSTRLSFAGKYRDGKMYPVENSGLSIGTLQKDLGQDRQSTAKALVHAYQVWANAHQPDTVLTDAQQSSTIADLSRNGHTINDQQNRSLDATIKSQLDAFLKSDNGKDFVHQRDQAQVDNICVNALTTLTQTPAYQQASIDDQIKLATIVAKAFNQSEVRGKALLKAMNARVPEANRVNSLKDVQEYTEHFTPAMRDGRDAALRGADIYIQLRHASPQNPLHDAWQAVLDDPLIPPTQIGQDAARPHLAAHYTTIKNLFLEPARSKDFISALEQGHDYSQGLPQVEGNHRATSGFFASATDFVQWNADGKGVAYLHGEWSEITRDDITRVRHADTSVDLAIHRSGALDPLLRVGPNGPAMAQSIGVRALQQGMHGDDVRALQSQLAQQGYTDTRGRPLPTDGEFGAITHTVVQAFQRDHGLQDDGKVGPHTLAALEHSNQQRQAPTQDTARAPEATPTAHAPALDANTVRTMQTQLHTLGITDMHQQPVAVTGIYDPSTQTAVARFQAEQGMPVTGHADDATRAALQSRAFIADLQQLSESSPSIRAPRDTHPLREEHAPNQAAPTLSQPAQTPAREDPSASTRTRSASDPRTVHASHYADLKQRFPELSEEHLAAAAVAIHKAGIPPNKPLYEADMLTNGTLRMLTESPMYGIVRVDMKAAPPSIEQSITQVQTYDAHHAQIAQNQQQQMAHGQHGR